MDQLQISLVQPYLHWEEPDSNRQHLYHLIQNIADTDLIILPEMFATGFTMQPLALAEPESGASVRWMKKLAREKEAAVCGSLVISENNKFYNRLFFVKPDGSYHTYNKRHLFTLAGEEKVYTAGKEQLVVEYAGWKIMPLVCYDLRFPVWCRNTAEAELMIFVANWPERRSEAWKSLLKARAIENMCYVTGVNRVGNDGNEVFHSGDSGVYDELGQLLSDFAPGQEQVKTFTLQKEQVHRSRERFSFLKDRDLFRIEV